MASFEVLRGEAALKVRGRGACGKKQFTSREEADIAREGMRRPKNLRRLRAYRCDTCPGEVWHLGHSMYR